MFDSLFDKTKTTLVTLRFSILTVFISLILITTLSIILLRSLTFARELSYTSFEIMKYAATIVQHRINSEISPAAIQAEFTANLLEKSVLLDNKEELVPYTYYMLTTMPLAKRVFWADEHGDYIYSIKENNGSITTQIYDKQSSPPAHTIIQRDVQGNVIEQKSFATLDYDPRLSTWYDTAKKIKQFQWTDVHLFHPSPSVGIGAMAPVINKNGEFAGVFGINISLEHLKQFITDLHFSPHGYVFIATSKEDLIAYPDRPPFTEQKMPKDNLPNIHATSLSFIDKAMDYYLRTKQSQFSLNDKKETYLVTFVPVKELSTSHDWLIGVVTPRRDFIGPLQRMNMLTLGLSFIILALGILIVSKLVSRIIKPINALANETEKIKRFELDGDMHIHSRIKEVVRLRDAMKSMKIGLKSFQKYVPKILVRQLIELGEDVRIGGVRKPLVVLFSDIQNFTSIAEFMDPKILTIQLCEYFEALTQLIIEEKGTIDKYIGDSIMAFWGAPLTEENPAEHAANAALRCEELLEKLNNDWRKQGKPILTTRIGINMGDAIVGNLGSSERFSYTAFGDTINTANRLEGINKVYKTKIIVSEAVYQAIKDKFVLKMVDYITVKGRKEPIRIYELLSNDPNKLSFDIHAYRTIFEKGFRAYQDHAWEEAIIYFKKCHEIYPADSVALVFIRRCEAQQRKHSN